MYWLLHLRLNFHLKVTFIKQRPFTLLNVYTQNKISHHLRKCSTHHYNAENKIDYLRLLKGNFFSEWLASFGKMGRDWKKVKLLLSCAAFDHRGDVFSVSLCGKTEGETATWDGLRLHNRSLHLQIFIRNKVSSCLHFAVFYHRMAVVQLPTLKRLMFRRLEIVALTMT